MRVEVVHVRHLDFSCDVLVIVDGELVSPARYVSVDPGAGWDRVDWNEHWKESLKDLSPEAFVQAALAFEAASESEHISDHPSFSGESLEVLGEVYQGEDDGA